MNQAENEGTKTVFQASFHVFIPLRRIKKEWKVDFTNSRQQVVPDSRIRNTEASLWYWELKGMEQDYSYCYCLIQKDGKQKDVVSRKVTLRLFLVKFVSNQLNRNGRYHLVIGIGIDRAFADGTTCSDKDLIYLKKALYEKERAGLHSPTGSVPYFHDWLGAIVEQITGQSFFPVHGV